MITQIYKRLQTFVELADCKLGNKIEIIASLNEKRNLSESRIVFVLFDGTDYYNLNVFGDKGSENLTVGSIYLFQGTVTTANKHNYLNLEAALAIAYTDEVVKRFKPWEYQKLTPTNMAYFLNSIQQIKSDSYRRYVELAFGIGVCPKIYKQSDFKKLHTLMFEAPASIHRHDSYPGGLVNHIVGGNRILDAIQNQYGSKVTKPLGRVESANNIDWDLLRAAWDLHDIGKPDTYDMSGLRQRFKEGTLIQHEQQGAMKLYRIHIDIIEPELRLDYENFQKLLYCIMMHGNVAQHPFQSDNIPQELRILALIDGLDTACSDALIL